MRIRLIYAIKKYNVTYLSIKDEELLSQNSTFLTKKLTFATNFNMVCKIAFF